MKLYCHTDLILVPSDRIVATKGKVYEAASFGNGDLMIRNDENCEHSFSTNNDEDDYRQWFTKEEPKIKPTIIKLPNGHKIVFNPPYTLYTDGKVTGKAKCNPADEYKAEVGLKFAVERYQKAKTEKIFKVTFQNDRHYGLPETVSATLSKKIDEEIWGMFTRAIGGNR